MSYGFDVHTFLRSSNAAPATTFPPIGTPAPKLREQLKELILRITELDNEQLAALYTAVECEHVNRQAELAGMDN